MTTEIFNTSTKYKRLRFGDIVAAQDTFALVNGFRWLLWRALFFFSLFHSLSLPPPISPSLRFSQSLPRSLTRLYLYLCLSVCLSVCLPVCLFSKRVFISAYSRVWSVQRACCVPVNFLIFSSRLALSPPRLALSPPVRTKQKRVGFMWLIVRKIASRAQFPAVSYTITIIFALDFSPSRNLSRSPSTTTSPQTCTTTIVMHWPYRSPRRRRGCRRLRGPRDGGSAPLG